MGSSVRETATIDVTLSLPDKLYEKARQWAAVTHQDLDEALADALELVLTPLPSVPELDDPIEALSDSDLLAQTRLQLPADRGQRLSELSADRRVGTLSPEKQQKLLGLTQIYQRYWLRQSEALAEAVRRELLPAMHS
jgi:hypothetical protein